MLISSYKNIIQNHNVRNVNKSYECMKFKYFRSTAKNQNYIHDKMASNLVK
jgi:hypothetical protein